MKFISKELSSKRNINIFKTFLLTIILTSICLLSLPTVSVEGKSNDLENKIVLDKNLLDNTNIHNVNLNKNITVNLKQIKGNAQSLKWTDEILERVNIVIENCKGKFSSLDMILMPLNLNSNQWINH